MAGLPDKKGDFFMNKLFNSFLLGILASFLVAGSAMAVPVGASVNQDYWTITDHTTGTDGSSFNIIMRESASYESEFGFYTVDSMASPTSVDKYYKIFSKGDEVLNNSSVYYKNEGGSFYLTDAAGYHADSWTLFDNYFGFYYKVYTGGVADTSADYIWHTDIQFNVEYNAISGVWQSVDTDIEHVATAFNGIDVATIYLDDQKGGGDRDWTDMTVMSSDIAPVPEPATMLLFGTGLIGLAGIARRKTKA